MKLSLSGLLDTAKALSTEPGKKLSDLVNYVYDIGENLTRFAKNNITFADNIDCQFVTALLRDQTKTLIGTKKTPVGIIPIRVANNTTNGIDTFQWHVDNNGVQVNVKFSGTVSGQLSVVFLIIY